MQTPFSGTYLCGLVSGPLGDTSADWSPPPVPVVAGGSRSFHRLRSEKTRQEAEGRGFDSRHLHARLGPLTCTFVRPAGPDVPKMRHCCSDCLRVTLRAEGSQTHVDL